MFIYIPSQWPNRTGHNAQRCIVMRYQNLFCILRAAAAHHSSLETGNVTSESLLFFGVHIPFILEWIESHVHNAVENITLAAALNAFDDFVEDPSSW